MKKNCWYKETAFYQIWPRSFMDGNGDGIGDLYGIYDKLDYIKSLNVDGIWFSPLYVSPNADYGYDIADYMQISPDYGDLDIFKKVLDGAHQRGLRVIMDLVINHTSDEHHWFKASSADKNSPYHDYYFWRKGKANGKPPNNWDSIFEGKAWEYNPMLDEYYLHIFSKKQPDLNMDNPIVRDEIKRIMRFWLDFGVDGFREDVIMFISKRPGLPNDYSPMYRGVRYCFNGPNVHKYLQEFKRDVLDHYDCITIGEAPMTTPDIALKFIKGNNKVLDMMFHFQHMVADCMFIEYMPKPFSLRELKCAFSRWQKSINGDTWNTLYLENHDHPRIINRYGNPQYRVESGKMLAASYLFQQGTPFIYQGQEIGMTNISFATIDEYKDVMAKNEYRKMKNKPEEKKMALIRRATRDSARTPMQWSAEKNAGFTTSEPWFTINHNFTHINVEKENADEFSILNFYRKALKFRKETPVALWGSYKEYYPFSKYYYVYEREYNGERLLVVCSFTEKKKLFNAPKGFILNEGKLVLANYIENPIDNNQFILRPYEARVYLFAY
jgi:oligo-1,6-glucosidase